MKNSLIKCFSLALICFASVASEVYLKHQSDLLSESQSLNEISKKTVLFNNSNNNYSKSLIGDHQDFDEQKSYVPKDKNLLPDIQFLEFFIDIIKEGIPFVNDGDL